MFKRENVQKWAFKLKSALAKAKMWHLRGCMLKVNIMHMEKMLSNGRSWVLFH
jgi:hypothetical protein